MRLNQLAIVNQALSILGARQIGSMTENTPEGVEANIHYNVVLEELLLHDWSFARRNRKLTLVSPQDNDRNKLTRRFRYILPDDNIKILQINSQIAGCIYNGSPLNLPILFERTENFIDSDLAGLSIKYITRDVEPADFPIYFRKAFIHALASAMATKLTGNMNYAISFRQIAEQELASAKAQDFNENGNRSWHL